MRSRKAQGRTALGFPTYNDLHRPEVVPCPSVRSQSPFCSPLPPSPPTSPSSTSRPVTPANTQYVANRTPLQPSGLVRLPPGAVKPEGWLKAQLRMQADGFHGHLQEISAFLKKEGNAWLSKDGRGQQGWEEVPYWLKGYLNCAYALGDEKMIKEAQVWIEGAINSQQADGWFGPGDGRKGAATDLVGKDDLWPNMIMLMIFTDYYEKTGDKRVLEVDAKYFKYLETVPEKKFLVGYWPSMRAGISSTHPWLYNRTGEEWLLDLAKRTHRHTARGTRGSSTGTTSTSPRRSASRPLTGMSPARRATWRRRRRSGGTCATGSARCRAACSGPTRTPATATPARGR